ncbi:MAG: hypothetical protein D6786_01890 [Gammaproteobacteria bacterium]|nr:MAG: hypothetical protein D6786_01890 [Gammaproteobacteria bacterium]
MMPNSATLAYAYPNERTKENNQIMRPILLLIALCLTGAQGATAGEKIELAKDRPWSIGLEAGALSTLEFSYTGSLNATRVTRPIGMITIGYDLGPLGQFEFGFGKVGGGDRRESFPPGTQLLNGQDVIIRTSSRNLFSMKERLSLRLTRNFYLTGGVGFVWLSKPNVTAVPTSTTTTEGMNTVNTNIQFFNGTDVSGLAGGGFTLRASDRLKARADIFAYKGYSGTDYYGTFGLTYQF